MSEDETGKAKDLIEWLGVRALPDFTKARWLGAGVGVVLVIFFLLAVLAAGTVLIHTIGQAMNPATEGPNLGAGALIAGLLGAPFLIWSTVLKHQTVRYQKEGHITDRINKAVEQLGAEKKVDRIGRAVTIWTGTPIETEFRVGAQKQFEGMNRTRIGAVNWEGEFAGAAQVLDDGKTLLARTWPRERVIVEYKDEPPVLSDNEVIGAEGDWKVFSETIPNLEVRIGAIMSLERIAQDSTTHDKGRDHVRVMEILCAYVRENSNARKPESSLRQDWDREQKNWDDDPSKFERWFCQEYAINPPDLHEAIGAEAVKRWANTLPTPRADITLALGVIGRRTDEQKSVEEAWPKPPSDRRRLLLDGPEGTGFQGWKRKIDREQGFRLDLRGSNLQGADLSGMDFSGALFDGARLEGIKATKSRKPARFAVASFRNAVLDGANLDSADCRGSNFDQTSAMAARLTNTRMSAAVFRNAAFSLPEMASKDGTRVTSGGFADIDGAVFVEGTDLSGIDISQESLEQTFGDVTVKLPKSVVRPSHWPTWDFPKSGENSIRDQLEKWRADPAGYQPPNPEGGTAGE